MAKDPQYDSVHDEAEYLDLFGVIWAEADASDSEHDRKVSADLHARLSRGEWPEDGTSLSPSNQANHVTDVYKRALGGDRHAKKKWDEYGNKVLRSGLWTISFKDVPLTGLILRPAAKHPGGRPRKEVSKRI